MNHAARMVKILMKVNLLGVSGSEEVQAQGMTDNFYLIVAEASEAQERQTHATRQSEETDRVFCADR
jgi:hypothetical protein